MKQKNLYLLIILIGLVPTIGIFVWGINESLKTKSEVIVPFFSQMK